MSNSNQISDEHGSIVISRQSWQTILDQLAGVLKKNDELSQKVDDLQGKLDRLTDQAVDVELLKAKVRSLTEGVHRGDHRGRSSETNGGLGTASSPSTTPRQNNSKVKLEPSTSRAEGHRGGKPKLEDHRGAQAEIIVLLSDDEDSTSSFSHPRDEDGHHHVAMKRKPSTDIHPGSTASGLVSSKKAKLVKAESESPRKVGIAFEPPASVPPLADEKSSVSDEPGSSGSPPITSTSSRSKPRVKVPPSKVRTGTLQLKEEDVDRYLHGFSPIPISSPLSLEISLELLNKNYGSITQGLLWEKGPYKFLFPGYDTNPLMPTSPGEPGLLLSARTEVVRDTWTLFIKILNNSKARWNYAGEYRGAVVGSLGAKGFSEQPEKVKRTWGTKIAHHKKFEPYLRMRARITLRKLGKALSELNIQRELEEIKKRPKTSSKISSDDVIEAFESGHETIPIIRMTCVQYRHSFAQDLSSLASTAPAAGRGNAAVGGGSGTHQTIIRSGSSLKKGKQKAMSGNQTPSSQPEGSDSEGSD